MILPGMPHGEGEGAGQWFSFSSPGGAFSWASSMAQLVGGMSTARDRGTGR